MKPNPDKVRLGLKEEPFIGHLLTAEGQKEDPAKVEAIWMMPRPMDVESKDIWEWTTVCLGTFQGIPKAVGI